MPPDNQPIKNKSTNENISWNNGEPYSLIYDDIYYSRAHGILEKKHVFIDGNKLEKKFKKLAPYNSFVIAETGFGIGLNFLCAVACFNKNTVPNVTLHYISFEKHILTKKEYQRALANFDICLLEKKQLLAQLPTVNKGRHQLTFNSKRITLTLILGDINHTLTKAFDLNKSVDAWFFDGFSPSKNKTMWELEVFKLINQYSKPNASYATYTCASSVRNNLFNAGFTVAKKRGFGNKKHMLSGELKTQSQVSTTYGGVIWLKQSPIKQTSNVKNKSIGIIGGGLAGCLTANSLALKGYRVTILEKNSDICLETSNHKQMLLYPKLSANATILRDLIIQGYLHTQSILKSQNPEQIFWQQTGLIQLAYSHDELTKLERLVQDNVFGPDFFAYLDQQSLSRLSGINLEKPGLWMPSACTIQPKKWCRYLIDHPNIRLMNQTCVTKLQSNNQTSWTVSIQDNNDIQNSMTFDKIVICSGHVANEFVQTKHLPLKIIRGQVTLVRCNHVSSQLKTAICAKGIYIACKLWLPSFRSYF